MRTGVIALIDALGFKGIWKRHSAEDVLRKLRELNQTIELLKERHEQEYIQGFLSHAQVSDEGSIGAEIKLEVKVLSDSIFLACWPGDVSGSETDDAFRERMERSCLISMVRELAAVTVLGPAKQPGLAYRGCVAFGEFEEDDDFFVGPAVDEAAGHMDAAEGAFVWFTESALRLWASIYTSSSGTEWLVGPSGLCDEPHPDYALSPFGAMVNRYPVPLKRDQTYQTTVINPLAHFYHAIDELDALTPDSLGLQEGIHRGFTGLAAGYTRAVEETFRDDRASVKAKWENTLSFLHMAYWLLRERGAGLTQIRLARPPPDNA